MLTEGRREPSLNDWDAEDIREVKLYLRDTANACMRVEKALLKWEESQQSQFRLIRDELKMVNRQLAVIGLVVVAVAVVYLKAVW